MVENFACESLMTTSINNTSSYSDNESGGVSACHNTTTIDAMPVVSRQWHDRATARFLL